MYTKKIADKTKISVIFSELFPAGYRRNILFALYGSELLLHPIEFFNILNKLNTYLFLNSNFQRENRTSRIFNDLKFSVVYTPDNPEAKYLLTKYLPDGKIQKYKLQKSFLDRETQLNLFNKEGFSFPEIIVVEEMLQVVSKNISRTNSDTKIITVQQDFLNYLHNLKLERQQQEKLLKILLLNIIINIPEIYPSLRNKIINYLEANRKILDLYDRQVEYFYKNF